MKKIVLKYLSVFVVVILFVVASFLVQKNVDIIKLYIGDYGILGAFLYIWVTIIAIVFAPVTTMPLIPLAANIWGWFWAGVFSIIGWVVGSAIAFWLARNLGWPILKKFPAIKNLQKFESKIPQSNIFWSVVFLRIVMPVDILSYALGLFSNISFTGFILATTIGVIPFAFIYSFLGTLPIYFQIISFFVAISLIIVGYLIKKNN